MSIIDEIKKRYPLPEYIESQTGMSWKPIGSWKTLQECPLCSGHNCFRLSSTNVAFCFQCYTCIPDSVKARMLFENLTYSETVDKFKDDLGIKKYEKKDIEWVSLRELACEYTREVLFTSQTKYQFRNETVTPLEYLTEYRKHSYEAILNFRLGFNDGGLVDYMKEKGYSIQSIKATGLDKLPDKCFLYPFIVDNEIKYFRIKDPNKLKKWQMPLLVRSNNAVWFNQDVIKEGQDIVITEGEDDVISLWDCEIHAIASCGVPTINQINFLKTKELSCVYLAYDNDPAGLRDCELFIRNYNQENLYLIGIDEGKDIDDLIRESDDPKSFIQELKVDAQPPKAEFRSNIRHKDDGYYIIRKDGEKRLTNWTLTLEAVIIRGDQERLRKMRLKSGNYKTTILMPSVTLASASRLREFINSVSDKLLWFTGFDNDLAHLVQYLDLVSDPKIVRESDCVGEINEGFIAENIFISNNDEFRPLNNGFLSVDDTHSIRIVELVKRGSSRSEVPYFPLVEPVGGIDAFKDRVFDLMIKNRNLKMALAIGWLKATLWSRMFWEKKRFFPILAFHGKFAGGKSLASQWLMSLVGMRECNPEMLSDKGTTEVGLARKFAYYSNLPIFVDDYRNDESGQRFHTFFRGVFDRSSPTKGLKEDFGVRRVNIRGCLLLNGESCPTDVALLSRMISIELTVQERNDKYYKDIVRLEPQFACVGLNWIKGRTSSFPAFMGKYGEIEEILQKEIDDPRQASVMSVAISGALSEPYFQKKKEDLIDFAVQSARMELEERKIEEIMGTIWQAVDVLHKRGHLNNQQVNHDTVNNTLEVHLPGLLSEIAGNQFTKHYKLPNLREVAKILKQEPYFTEIRTIMIDNKQAKRWVFDLDGCPSSLKDIFITEQGDFDKF